RTGRQQPPFSGPDQLGPSSPCSLDGRRPCACDRPALSKMNILSIETSCDETALSIVECSGGIQAPRFKVLKNLINSQIPIHRPFGGVVPNLAKREHIKNLPKLLKQLKIGNLKLKI